MSARPWAKTRVAQAQGRALRGRPQWLRRSTTSARARQRRLPSRPRWPAGHPLPSARSRSCS
eukprot:5260476-Lingulodinium_polyedra.AAC.1